MDDGNDKLLRKFSEEYCWFFLNDWTPGNLLIQNTILIRYNTYYYCRPSSVGRALGC